MKNTRSLLAALLALTVVAGAFTGGVAAATAASLTANPSAPGATAQHTATLTAGSTVDTSSWNGFQVNYQGSGTDASNVSVEDVATIGIDRGDNQTGDAVDVNVSDDLASVSTSNNGATLTFDLGGSYSLYEGDEVVVVYEDVANPDQAGSYNVTLDINPQSSGSQATATFDVENALQSETTTQTTTQTTSGDTTADDTTSSSTTMGSADTTTSAATTTESDDSGSSGGSPGFGLGVGLLAVAGAAFLALRD
ncbi:hypothetical protein [Salarchaeum sp. JOR-1]|uniref:hypothetical protein n=1 Tax=Salarchaeum sp. JOR-1 TaxID=2599399 RepID=UPI0011987B72|nr:hypothetical protein [Salarchaeum sp. JOR-1]QDX39577.1 hypothetical protein FQU85_01235 [Salarchaeum sp. JOR-1]